MANGSDLLSARIAHMHCHNGNVFIAPTAAMFVSNSKRCQYFQLQSYRAILGILNEMFAYFLMFFRIFYNNNSRHATKKLTLWWNFMMVYLFVIVSR